MDFWEIKHNKKTSPRGLAFFVELSLPCGNDLLWRELKKFHNLHLTMHELPDGII